MPRAAADAGRNKPEVKHRTTIAAAVALTAALGLSGCGSDDGGSDSAEQTTTTVAATTTTAAAYPPVPTVEKLNADLAMAFDETVPLEQKIQLVQGAEQDPELINKVAAAAKANNAQIEVIDVVDGQDGTATAGINMVIGDAPPNPGTVMFVVEDGVWKMSKDNACGFVALAQLTSPACA